MPLSTSPGGLLGPAVPSAVATLSSTSVRPRRSLQALGMNADPVSPSDDSVSVTARTAHCCALGNGGVSCAHWLGGLWPPGRSVPTPPDTSDRFLPWAAGVTGVPWQGTWLSAPCHRPGPPGAGVGPCAPPSWASEPLRPSVPIPNPAVTDGGHPTGTWDANAAQRPARRGPTLLDAALLRPEPPATWTPTRPRGRMCSRSSPSQSQGWSLRCGGTA